ncbi:MAG: hypothetical protein FD124_914 [Alphaproteobacteria bacterium]|nr:MAG: hypothetical protein FD160_1393 [Caulobacteraceae bacterium]TPW07743.1 MAG: hypothetical protein FD124_914 [Alphaproteobacteria bacterium]
MRFLVATASTAALLLCGIASAEGVAGVTGRWRTERHGALVDIQECSDRSPCGVLAWAAPATTRGVVTDQRNPDRSLRRRPLIGLPILWGLTPAKAGWEDGRLYNPDTGQTFRSSLRLTSARQLHVTGCLGPLCRTEVWTRVTPSQQKGL